MVASGVAPRTTIRRPAVSRVTAGLVMLGLLLVLLAGLVAMHTIGHFGHFAPAAPAVSVEAAADIGPTHSGDHGPKPIDGSTAMMCLAILAGTVLLLTTVLFPVVASWWSRWPRSQTSTIRGKQRAPPAAALFMVRVAVMRI